MEMPHYALPNVLADAVREVRGMRVHAWRGIGAGYNKFAVECFLDEVAAATGKDPLDLRLELTRGDPRANAVIRAAAEMSDFRRKRSGRGMGIAFAEYHGTLSAGVAEVSVDRSSARSRCQLRVAVVRPDHQPKSTQLGSYGRRGALRRLTVKGGAVQQSIPPAGCRAGGPPTGMGRSACLVAPAIANAVFSSPASACAAAVSPERVKTLVA
jgi:isoquinoline 1-oxidoreductase beta subunit